MKWLFLIIVLLIFIAAESTIVILGDSVMKKPESCQCNGYTLIEYGVGVTNCGDTVLVKMPGDLYREFKEKQDD